MLDADALEQVRESVPEGPASVCPALVGEAHAVAPLHYRSEGLLGGLVLGGFGPYQTRHTVLQHHEVPVVVGGEVY